MNSEAALGFRRITKNLVDHQTFVNLVEKITAKEHEDSTRIVGRLVSFVRPL